ncbi:siderophore ABC transporter substrate-binding protein [Paenibacillus sp. GCM10027626]|uniref:siderophore ABC transporter substrate-binding protein n=1 Tax=Paenibacillus sp. GCM10027626 TaxID=3273411 RepID=UPI00362C2E08
MKAKISLVLLSILLVAVLAACGSKEANNPAPADKGNKITGSASANNATGKENAANNGNGEASQAWPMTIKHKLGEAPLDKKPEKVVVFDSGVLDTLDVLGVPVAAAPRDGLPAYLKKYSGDEYTNAGTLFEPDFEKLNALKPDVIFISGRSSEAYDELNKIAPTIFMGVDTANYYDSFVENMKNLGLIFEKQSEVEAELAKLDDEIATVREAYEASGKKGLIVLTNAGKMSAYGKGSRFGLIHDVLGVAPSDDNIEVSTHGMSVTSEYIAEKNPDFLFVIDRSAVVQSEGGETAQQTIENDLVKNTNASKDGKIIYLDPNYWYLSGGGLASMSEMVKEVGAAIK